MKNWMMFYPFVIGAAFAFLFMDGVFFDFAMKFLVFTAVMFAPLMYSVWIPKQRVENEPIEGVIIVNALELSDEQKN